MSILKIPDGSEFSKHPDFRTIASIFLGWVFITSMASMASSPLVQTYSRPVFRYLSDRLAHRASSTHSEKNVTDSVRETNFNTIRSGDSPALLIMYMCFATGSIANFASLLSFGGRDALCAFAVAWGSLATQAARLMGILTLLLTMRHLGMSQWESISLLFWLLVGLVFIFINTALAVGVTIPEPLNISLCYRKHFLPASLVFSLVYVALELFIFVRLHYLLPPAMPYSPSHGEILLDSRALRTASLLVLDLLILVPSAINTNTLADFIPYSIGSIIVLAAFNRRVDDWDITNGASTPRIHSMSHVPRSPLPVLHLTRPTEESIHPFANYPIRSPSAYRPSASRSVEDPTSLHDEGEHRLHTAHSSRTIDSVYACSVQGAIVHTAKRARPPELNLEFAHFAGSAHQLVPVKSAPIEDYHGLMGTVLMSDSGMEPTDEHLSKPVRPKLMIVTQVLEGWPSRAVAKHILPQSALQPLNGQPMLLSSPGVIRNGATGHFSSCTISPPVSYMVEGRTPSTFHSQRTSVSSVDSKSFRLHRLDTSPLPGELTKENVQPWFRSPPNSATGRVSGALPAGPRSPGYRRVRVAGR